MIAERLRIATIVVFVAGAFPTGCNSGSDPAAPDPDPNDEISDDERPSDDIEGQDIDGDMIRDDVQAWLEASFSGAVLDRMRLHAELHQRVMTTSDDDQVPPLLSRIEENGYCLWTLLDADKPRTTRELFARTLNTEARYQRFHDRERGARRDEVARAIPPEDEFASRCETR